MSFIGRPHLSGAVLVWDGEKLVSDKAVINLQSAYENANSVSLTNPVVFSGDSSVDYPKLKLVHSSSFDTDEGLRTSTATIASTAWLPFTSYDINDNKVFEVGTDTDASYVAVTSNTADGNSGYQFMNELGTFMALDTSSSPTVLRIQKADEGYIDFGGSAYASPVLRIDTNNTTPAVNIGSANFINLLTVNGVDITPYSSKIVIPISSTQNHELFNIGDLLDNDEYATVNIDVFASTNELLETDKRAFSAWKYFISLFKQSGVVKVVGITQLDSQTFAGQTATDDPTTWDINITTQGIIGAFGNGSQHKIGVAATITKISAMNILTGDVIK